jgi:hypothetical protein
LKSWVEGEMIREGAWTKVNSGWLLLYTRNQSETFPIAIIASSSTLPVHFLIH